MREQYEPARTPLTFAKYEDPYERERAGIIAALIPAGDGDLAVDVGCGPGFFSRLLAVRGWRPTAIDSEPRNLESAARFAAVTEEGDAVRVLRGLPDGRYGLVVAFEIIEHMPRPRGEELAAEARRILRPGGRLILSTPNRLSPQGLGGYYWDQKIRRRRTWRAWDETHVHIYSSREIRRLLVRQGFVVDRTTGYYYEGSLPFVGRWKLPLVKTARFPLSRFGFDQILECHRP